MDWQEKVTVQDCGRALVKPKNQPGGLDPNSNPTHFGGMWAPHLD